MLLSKVKLSLIKDEMYRDCKMNIKNSTKKVILELTTACNLSCKHCFYQNSNEFSSNCFIKKEKAFKIIDKASKNKVNKLVLTGGEPTIHPDFVEIAEYAKKKVSKVSLCTNGVISKKTRDKIIDLDFNTYTVSVDSHIKEVHDDFRGKRGAFEEVLLFTNLVFRNNKNLSIHITLHEKNIDHIKETISFCKKFQCEIVVGSIYYEKLGFNDKIVNKYQSKIKDFKKKYLDDKEIILAGFSKYCKSKNCKDQKQVFTVNSHGQIVSCYWKKGGGKIISKY